MDAFGGYHPIVNLLYYMAVLGISMFFLHPVFLLLGLAGAVAYSVCLKGAKAVRMFFCLSLPACLVTMAANPLFSHEGATMLFYLRSGNPITLESILYGAAAGVMLAAVISWFSSFSVVMTSDKLMYLFGKVLPAFSLLLSMTLRFVPKYTEQIRRVAQAQQCIGRGVANGKLRERAGHGLKILSITTTWALENSVETADSMKSRAYGLRGRTNFTVFRFDKRDGLILSFLALVTAGLAYALGRGWVSILYFPVFSMNGMSRESLLVYAGYGILCFLPVILNLLEDVKWRYLQSKI